MILSVPADRSPRAAASRRPAGGAFLGRGRAWSRLGPVDGGDGLTEVPDDVPFAGQELVAPDAALTMAPGALVGSLLGGCSAGGFLGSALPRDCGEVGQLTR